MIGGNLFTVVLDNDKKYINSFAQYIRQINNSATTDFEIML